MRLRKKTRASEWPSHINKHDRQPSWLLSFVGQVFCDPRSTVAEAKGGPRSAVDRPAQGWGGLGRANLA